MARDRRRAGESAAAAVSPATTGDAGLPAVWDGAAITPAKKKPSKPALPEAAE